MRIIRCKLHLFLRGVTPALPNRGNGVIISVRQLHLSGVFRDLEQISKSDKKSLDKGERQRRIFRRLTNLTIIQRPQSVQSAIIKSIFESPPSPVHRCHWCRPGWSHDQEIREHFELKLGIEQQSFKICCLSSVMTQLP